MSHSSTRFFIFIFQQEHIELDTTDIKISDIYARTYNTPGRKPTIKVPAAAATTTAAATAAKEEFDMVVYQIKNEHTDLKMDDHMETDLLPPVSSSFDIPSMDTTHISLSSTFNLSSSRNNHHPFMDKMSTISPTMHMHKDSLSELTALKSEIKEEKLETDDVCKQFLHDDDFKPSTITTASTANHSLSDTLENTHHHHHSTKGRSNVMFGGQQTINKDDKKKQQQQIYDVLMGNSSSKSSSTIYAKDENLNSSSIDSKFNENMLPLVSSLSASSATTSPATQTSISCSMASDLKNVNKSPGDKMLCKNSSLTFSDKSLKSDSFSDLDGIDIMRLPVDLGETPNIDILDDIVSEMKPDLLQETHACYLSLIRDVFCSTPDHRTTLENLHSKISAWVANPITALNDW